jgi:hypothetical protein
MPAILQYIQQLLAASPFVPFFIQLTSGENIAVVTKTGVTFPVTNQGVFVILSQGAFRAYTDQAIQFVELTTQ